MDLFLRYYSANCGSQRSLKPGAMQNHSYVLQEAADSGFLSIWNGSPNVLITIRQVSLLILTAYAHHSHQTWPNDNILLEKSSKANPF